MPTKPGTAARGLRDLGGALKEVHDHDAQTVVDTLGSAVLPLSSIASASGASVHEELDTIDSGVGGGGGGSGVEAVGVLVMQSGQWSSKHHDPFPMIGEEGGDVGVSGGETFPSASVLGARLDLDYYPSSHDDNTSSCSSSDTDNIEDEKELTLIRLPDNLNSTVPNFLARQTPQTNPPVPAPPSTLPPNQLHASSSLEDPCLQKHEGCPQDTPSPASSPDALQPSSGNIDVIKILELNVEFYASCVVNV